MSDSASQYVSLLKEVFDPKGRGYAKIDEVEGLLLANGYSDERAAIIELLTYLNPDDQGRVSLKNAAILFEPKFISLSEPSNIQTNFSRFDRDGDGYISVSDLVQASEELGFSIDSDQGQVMVAHFDLDGDHKLSLSEFGRIFRD